MSIRLYGREQLSIWSLDCQIFGQEPVYPGVGYRALQMPGWRVGMRADVRNRGLPALRAQSPEHGWASEHAGFIEFSRFGFRGFFP
jgi:hypothetical protein